MTANPTGPTRALANFCAGLTFEKLSSDVVLKAKLCVLDYIANAYGSLKLSEVRNVSSYVKELGGPETATAIGCGYKTGIHNAAFINGTTGEAIEAQDGLRFGGNHPGAAVIPAAFAIAEKSNLGGKEILTAIVAGYEAANRVAASVHPHHTLGGFLPTGTTGAFGAAVAASKLSGHDAETMLNSIGAAGYVLPLSMAEHLMGGYTAKIVQAGQAASAGMTAAGLAGAGITAPPFTLEGSTLKGGFTQITTRGSSDVKRITAGLGEQYSILDIYFKPFSACRHTHGAAEATLKIKNTERFNPADIKSINVLTYAIATIAVGKTVSANDSFVSAQFSIPYVVAACLIDGAFGPEQLLAEKISSESIIELSKKVSISIDPELNKAYPEKTSTRVEIQLPDRSVSELCEIPLGDPRNPMSPEDIAAKLMRFSEGGEIGDVKKIVELVLNMENLSSIRELASLL